jgi:sodium-independent sulfate anion transporter 11
VHVWHFFLRISKFIYTLFQYGLYAAYMGCFMYALLGSTNAVTIGPTALLALVIYDSGATQMGPEAAILLAFLTGCIVLLFGLLNFGITI